MLRFFLFLLFPALELYLLVKVGSLIGALNMVAWVFISAALGIWVLREQGRSALNTAQAEFASGRVPPETILNGLSAFLAGILLILPGLITDSIGLLLLIPFARKAAAAWLVRWLGARQAARPGSSGFFFMSSGGSGFGGGTVFRTFGASGGRPAAPAPEDPRQGTIIDCTAENAEPSGSRADDPRRTAAADYATREARPSGDRAGTSSGFRAGGYPGDHDEDPRQGTVIEVPTPGDSASSGSSGAEPSSPRGGGTGGASSSATGGGRGGRS